MSITKPKILVVVGPTASGKSELAVKLAKKFNGEIISADSRQVYRGLDIGAGKVEGSWDKNVFIYKDVSHHLIDEASPQTQFSVARFQRQAQKTITEILKRRKLPIICGGTGHWIDAVVFNKALPPVKPDLKLRKELEGLSVGEMFERLKKLDPRRASEIDAKNPRRLVRALEIVLTTGKPVPRTNKESAYDAIWLGIKPEQAQLHYKIEKRLKQRIKQGLVSEVEDLHQGGLSWKKLEEFGLEYKFVAFYLQGKVSKEEMFSLLLTAIKQYAKRQLTWWKRNQAIHWSSDPKELLTLAKKLL